MNYFDLHCDTIYEMYVKGQDFKENNLAIDGKRRKIFNKHKQVYSVWSNPELTDYDNYKRFFEIVNYAKSKEEFPEIAGDIESQDAIIGIEGAGILENDAYRLDILYSHGVRVLTLAWEGENCLAGAYNTDKGLTAFGKTVCEACAEKGISVDVSHLSHKGIYEVIDIAKTVSLPIMASHSCLKELCDTERNLSSEQAKRIADLGGVIGINFVGSHLNCHYENEGATIDHVRMHIEKAISLAGAESVCIGADFDGTEKLPHGINGIEDIEKIYNALKVQTAERVFYNNAYNYFKRVLGEGRK